MLSVHSLNTVAQTLQQLTQVFESHSSTPRLDAELLITHVLERPRSFIYTYPEHELVLQQIAQLYDYINRRLAGEPIAYLLGKQAFWTLELTVTPDTLIPRPETEHLVEWALTNLPQAPITLADLGTGSGAIALALATERPQWSIHATDAAAATLNIATYNARQLDLQNVEFYLGDWLHALPQQKYTAIISNPPYIAPDDPHLANLNYEPIKALAAENQGLAAFEKIIKQAKTYLVPYGYLILEHGYNQADALAKLLKQTGFNHITSHCDLAQQTRFITARP